MKALESYGFPINIKWDHLASKLGISLDERHRLRQMALLDGGNFLHALEEILDWWIRNKDATWQKLFSAVEEVKDKETCKPYIGFTGIIVIILYNYNYYYKLLYIILFI